MNVSGNIYDLTKAYTLNIKGNGSGTYVSQVVYKVVILGGYSKNCYP